MKKLLTLFLAVLMIGSVLCACTEAGKDEDENTDNKGTDVSQNTGSSTVVTTEDPMDKYYQTVPEGNCSGYELTILNQTSSWALTTMIAEQDGDTINDAVARRNAAIEGKLGITISCEDISSGIRNKVEATYKTGDNTDIIWATPSDTMSLTQSGYIEDAKNISTLNTDNPWWYPEITDSINFGGTRFLTYSDIHLHFHESFYCVAFNKVLLDKYPDLTNPYDLVSNNQWTMKKMNEMMTVVADDLNGDQKMTGTDDLFGLCAHSNQGYSMLVAMDAPLLVYDEGKPRFDEVDQHYVDSYITVMETLFNKELTVNTNYDPVFTAGRSLFMIEVTGAFQEHREDEYEYGIVVIPKYNKKQENYISPITVSAETMGIIKNSDDSHMERLGVILENMAAQSCRTLKPEYYQVLVHLKYAKDEESIAMLDMVYMSGRFDAAYVYNFGGVRTKLENAFKANQSNISSLIAPCKDSVNTDINNYYEKLNLN